MTAFSQVYAALRRKNRGQYALLTGCSFFSVLLITAYACMMRSPTILSVLPVGGDCRKQVRMVGASETPVPRMAPDSTSMQM